MFLVNWGELEGRLDPKIVLYQTKTTHFKYKTERLANLLKFNPQYGANEAGIPRISIDEPRYIRITDIDEYGLLKPDIGKTAEVIEPQYFLENNDILFARSGSVGRAYIHKTKNVVYPSFYAGYLIKFVINEEKVIPDYIFAYTQLKPYSEWVLAIQRTAAQPNINAEEYKSLQIPVPPKEVQAEIVAKMDAAYAGKKAKEAEAERLLASIDAYLLGELGIELPAEEENSVEKRMFIRPLHEVSGNRFDPDPYRIERLNAVESIKNAIYPAKPLYQVVNFRTNKANSISEETIYIGLENIESNTGHWIPSDEIKESISSATLFWKGDILFPKLRPYLNKVFHSHLKGLCSTEFHVLHSNSESNEYLANFLRSKIVVAQTKHLMSGNTLPRLQFNDIQKLLIPIPPISKQKEITEQIAIIRARAQQLRQEAEAELAQAKQDVEAMILGKN